eukprot:583743-Lingulodinium_polyedra.AAC.1
MASVTALAKRKRIENDPRVLRNKSACRPLQNLRTMHAVETNAAHLGALEVGFLKRLLARAR